MKATFRFGAALLLVAAAASAAPLDAPRNLGTGAVYRIARIDRETRTLTLRPVDPALTLSAKSPILQAEVLGFADLEHLVGGGRSAEEIVAGMEEGGDVTLYRDDRGHLTRLSY